MQVHDLCSKFKDAQFNAFMVGSSERFQESILMALSCWQVFSPSVSVCKLAARSKAWTKNCQLVILFTSGKKTSPAHIMSLRWCQPTHKKNSQWDYVGLSFQVGWELIYIYMCVCVWNHQRIMLPSIITSTKTPINLSRTSISEKQNWSHCGWYSHSLWKISMPGGVDQHLKSPISHIPIFAGYSPIP